MPKDSSIPILAAAAILLSGCADYLNRYDTVTLAVGDAQGHNMLLQTADPFNPAAQDNHIPISGRRIEAVLLGAPVPPPPSPAVSPGAGGS